MATKSPSEKPLGMEEELAIASERVSTDGDGQNLPTHIQSDDSTNVGLGQGRSLTSIRRNAWARFNGHGRKRIGFLQSVKAVVASSYLNALLLFLPFAWLSHLKRWDQNMTFALCFVSIIPLEKIFDWCGEQMALYLGLSLGDLLIITLNNAVEATLAIILLLKCELKILQSTIIGVIVLHLLLIPGTAFLIGGSGIWEQHLHPHLSQLNNSLLTVGAMSILLPTALFSALDGSTLSSEATTLPSDELRASFLHFSRGTAVILLVIYICSRIFLTNPPGEDNALELHPTAPEALRNMERELREAEPKVNSWVCLGTIIITIALMGVTAEFLVDSLQNVRDSRNITEEWFGLILLPLVSFAADGAVAVVYFLRTSLQYYWGKPQVPSELAKARAIDLSIQFSLFWMPFFVLLAWWVNKPLHMLFDLYEVAVLISSAFLVNHVIADAKTNWVEGLIMIGFYMIIALWTWFYVGQPGQKVMLACTTTVATALANEAAGGGATNGLVTGLL
ncbi:hypothetical protein BJ322DRAFT_1047593 [Thelephora terrestris]|uniref:Sodium/calcium exchanger membrane region domain-containing protein n=1 Tax=Thelephora terrestris TaxID=56493 RepID=A0A9P6HJ64_9AGAM|nr:hypothetical protein BJ322DRAFT_1047593 [Thelephora terrestris]